MLRAVKPVLLFHVLVGLVFDFGDLLYDLRRALVHEVGAVGFVQERQLGVRTYAEVEFFSDGGGRGVV